jgi:hypothetical protein
MDKIFEHFFPTGIAMMLNLTEYGSGYNLGDFFMKASGHPDLRQKRQMSSQHASKLY